MTFAANSRIWWIGLFVALGVLGWSFSSDFTAPWTDQIDGNGACWSQSAHNTLRVGLMATAGVPSAFYFDTPPIPPEGFYTHHPPLLSLLLTAMFAVLGEAEWVARLLPVGFSCLGAVLLWWLVKGCTNARTATFAVVAFAAMPMELRYGRMVNFEPIDLVWMLGALLGLRYWEHSGQAHWWWLAVAALALSLWTAWLGYLFVLVLCVPFCVSSAHRHRPLALLLVGMMVASLLLFLLQVHAVQPDAWDGMLIALNYRLARGDHSVSWHDWSVRMAGVLTAHIQPVLWLLGLGGALVVWKSKGDAPLRWLGWSAACFFAMNAFYVVAFRNASSIHDYASFYFTVPVAMLAGVALDAVCHWGESRGVALRLLSTAGALLLLGLVAIAGERQTVALRHPFRILSEEKAEPPELIPELGRAMRGRFGDNVAVICNFLPTYGPQLHYYAQHELLPCVFTGSEWLEMIADPENSPVGGAVWLEDPRAQEILVRLPPGPQERVTIRGIPFCFWRPSEDASKPHEQVEVR